MFGVQNQTVLTGLLLGSLYGQSLNYCINSQYRGSNHSNRASKFRRRAFFKVAVLVTGVNQSGGLCPRDITSQSFAGVVPVRHYPNSWDCGIFHIPPASNVVRNCKIPSDPRGGAQAPPRTARLLPRLSCSHCSKRLMREPAAFYVRSCDHLDVVADDPDCYLPALPSAPATSEVAPIHSLDCAKDGLDDAALVVLVHEPGQLVPVRFWPYRPRPSCPRSCRRYWTWAGCAVLCPCRIWRRRSSWPGRPNPGRRSRCLLRSFPASATIL